MSEPGASDTEQGNPAQGLETPGLNDAPRASAVVIRAPGRPIRAAKQHTWLKVGLTMLQLGSKTPLNSRSVRIAVALLHIAALVALAALLTACEIPENETVDPVEFEFELFGIPVNYLDAYAQLVNPSMDGKNCTSGGCHGLGPNGEAAPGKSLQLFPDVTVDRSVEMASNYVSALSNTTIGNAGTSPLLAKPLGTLSHVGNIAGPLWEATESEYRAAAAWTKQNVPDASALDFDTYNTVVSPILLRNTADPLFTCARATCHRKGESNAAVGGFFLNGIGAGVGTQESVINYLWTLANVDIANPGQSPLLLKPLAEAAGGVLHGGGPIFADTNDPNYQALLNWIQNPVPAPR